MPTITKIQDNIITIEGKAKYKQGQYYKLSPEADGVVISATENDAKLLVIGDPSKVKSKKKVSVTADKLEKIKAMTGYYGSIISPFGDIAFPAKKSKGKLIGSSLLDNNPPEMLDRIGLGESLETGILAIDTMIPIGKGQRELIIGDRTTGKSSIALSTIINQKDKGVKSVYVAVGQKRSSVINVYNTLKNHGAEENTIILFANPDSASEQFYAPKIGMAIAEAIAYTGEDVLVIVDDLTKHANVYREISLSIGKNPGREAYPTDIFYQHSRLLERAGRFNKKYKNGSISCLPIVETVQGDIASLIPSNVISITDGQIFTNADMFNNGEYPAIDIGLSVSRTGSAVQNDVLKNASKGLKAEYASLFDIKKFAEMSIDISDELKLKIKDWKAINNILLQYGYHGYSNAQIMILTELFKIKVLGDLIDRVKFSVAFIKYCKVDKAAIKLVKDVKANKYKQGQKEFREALKAVFVPLVKIASGIKTDIISEKEYNALKGSE